jgi:peptidoglycan-N-acetylglucosamine deacetylase
MQPPLLFKKLFRSFVWRIPTNDFVLFLTFDDGPVPEVTPAVLELLKKCNAKATFFCIGENVSKYPEIFQQVVNEGHAIGNHTYSHLKGWKTETSDYMDNIKACDEVIKTKSKFFRPPYGKMTLSQYRAVNKKYQIIMWDVLTEDWKESLRGEDCFRIVKRKAKSGSIVVFHDSIKAGKRMLSALEKTLQYFSEKGFRFDIIPSQV